jgi:hypothetical protein
MAVHVREAAHRLRDRVGGAPAGIRPGVPEGRDRRDDQARIRRTQGAGLVRSRGHDRDVGGAGECAERVVVVGIEQDASLAGGVEPEEQASLGIRRTVPEW